MAVELRGAARRRVKEFLFAAGPKIDRNLFLAKSLNIVLIESGMEGAKFICPERERSAAYGVWS